MHDRLEVVDDLQREGGGGVKETRARRGRGEAEATEEAEKGEREAEEKEQRDPEVISQKRAAKQLWMIFFIF